jgi:GAF domain-containing protein
MPADWLEMHLNIGLDVLQMDLGVICRVSGQEHTVQYSTNHNFIRQHRQLENTLCDLTLQHNAVFAITHIQQTVYREHPAYDNCPFECYIGIPLIVCGETYGTLNFIRVQPHAKDFSEADVNFIRALADRINRVLESSINSVT